MSLPLPERLAAAPAIKALTAPSDGKYRILLPLDRRGRRPGLLRLALTLARACEGEVLALHVITPEDERKGVDWELPEVDAEQLASVPHQILTHHADTIAKGILAAAREQACSLILLSWRGSPRALRSKLGNILDPVIEDAPCDVAILKGDLVHEWKQDAARRMLLASAGGPHAVAAARMAFSLARYTGGQVTLLTILGDEADQASADEADEVLDKLLLQATDLDAPLPDVERRIIRGGDIDTIITNAAREHDLVFLGATTQTVLSQLLLGVRGRSESRRPSRYRLLW
jgi:nucleotide-binding universal stress UspA family protein